jgi:heat shock protein HtpX
MNSFEWSRHKRVNRIQSLLLVTALSAVLALVGWLIDGAPFASLAVVIAVATYFVNPVVSPRLVLARYGTREITINEAPQLHSLVQALAGRARLPRAPALFYLPAGAINAFTVGTLDSAVIAVSDGALRHLDLRELTAVLAHEVSHIRHDDMRMMGFAYAVSRMAGWLSLAGQLLLVLNLPLLLFGMVGVDWFAVLLLIFAPTLGALLQLALSRTREYDADLGAARLTGDPEALASALSKMECDQRGVLARLLWRRGNHRHEPALLRTHPPTAERIRRLMMIRQSARRPAVARNRPFVTISPNDTRQHPLANVWWR